MRRDLLHFMHRQVSLCYFYTGQIQEVYNYAAQLTDAFPELRHYRNFQLHYLPLADHTFSRSSMRARLVELLIGWMQGMVMRHDATASDDEASPAAISGAMTGQCVAN